MKHDHMLKKGHRSRPARTALDGFGQTGFGRTLLLCAIFLAGHFACAQAITDSPAPPGVAPGSPDGTYHLSQIESINLFNGNLNVFVPILAAGGRGAVSQSLGVSVFNIWQVVINTSSKPPAYYPGTAYGSLGLFSPGRLLAKSAASTQSCGTASPVVTLTLTRLEFTEADGTTHELIDTKTNGQQANTGAICGSGTFTFYDRGTGFVSSDDSTIRFVSDTDIVDTSSPGTVAPSGYVYLNNGTTYRIDKNLISWIQDRNGNRLSYSYDPNSNVIAVQDALGRTINLASGTVTYPGFGGSTRTATIKYDSLSNHLRDGGSVMTVAKLFPELLTPDTESYNPQVISEIVLADGQSSYQFSYDVYAEAAKIVLPTGGSYQYDWASGWSPSTGGEVGNSSMVYRRVTARRMYDNTGALLSNTTYAAASAAAGGVNTVTAKHMDGSGNLISQDVHYFNGFPTNDISVSGTSYAAAGEGKEYETQWEDASGNVLRTETSTWTARVTNSGGYGPPAIDLRLTEQDERLDSGLVSTKTYGYSADTYNNITDLYEYDYGSGTHGSQLRHTQTSYYSGSSTVPFSSYVNVNLVSLPAEIKITGPTNTLVSDTTFTYDEGTPLSYPNLAGHDNVNFLGGGARGNVTTTSYCPTPGSCAWIASRKTYDIAGNVISSEDANGNTFTMSYKDAFTDGTNHNTYAFPTTITDPLKRPQTVTYDYGAAKPTAVIDENGVTTAYTYNDGLDRLTLLQPAAGMSLNGAQAQPALLIRVRTISTFTRISM